MRSTYPGKSVRLNDLSDEVLRFFEAKGFTVSTEKKPSQVVVSAGLAEGAHDRIVGVALANDADGSLNVKFESFEGSVLTRRSLLLPLFGGGFLTLKSLKISEILERLERDFWDVVDRFMAS
jgi:hypothetical protein